MAVQYFASAGVTTAFHPIGYAKVLIQLGHEPLDPIVTKTWFGFGREKFCYPNLLKYVGHIYRTDGFFGLYRGLGSRIAGGLAGSYVDKFVQKAINVEPIQASEPKEDSDELLEWFKAYVKQSSKESLAKCCGILASQPFHVIMIRQMAQFVGGETEYNSVFSSIGEIYRNDGILGFFAGIIPRVIGEAVLIFVSNFVAQLFNKYFVADKELQTYCIAGFGRAKQNLLEFTTVSTQLLIGQFTYPFQLVSNVMAVNNSGLVVSRYPYMDTYSSWWACWGGLKSKDQLSRGSSIFFRYVKGNVGISPTVYMAGSRRY